MPSARPRRTRRHGSRMGWRHEHARRGPGGGCCQACGARRIARWATQVVTVPHASGAGGAAIGRGRQRQRRRWQPAADLPLQHAPCGAGAGGAARGRSAARSAGCCCNRRCTAMPPAAVLATAATAAARQRRLHDVDDLHRVERVHGRHPLLLERLRRARTSRRLAQAVACAEAWPWLLTRSRERVSHHGVCAGQACARVQASGVRRDAWRA